MKNPLEGCSYDRAYQDLKGFSKNGDNFCKQLLSVLQQRADLEITYSKELEKLASKLTKLLNKKKVNYMHGAWRCISEEMKSASDLHRKLGKAMQTEAINPTNRVLEDHEKKKKALSNTAEKAANLVISNWRYQIKAKKKLKELTKNHEALFRDTESSQPLASPKTKKKLLRNLEKSATKLAKDEEDYYEKNIAACETRLKWEAALEICHQSTLDLEKERLHLLSNMFQHYCQHLSSFGKNLMNCHTKVLNGLGEVDTDKETRTLAEEMSLPTAETSMEFLLTDYYEEDAMSLIEKERRQASVTGKVLRLQKDLEKALKDKAGLERMLKANTETPEFSDAKNQNDITEQLDETTLKVALLQANHFKLTSVLAEIELKPKPTPPRKDYISKWKEKDCVHSSLVITCPVRMKRFTQTFCTSVASEGEINASRRLSAVSNSNQTASCQENSNSENGICIALYDYHAGREDELCFRKGDVIVIHCKEEDGWWQGALNGKNGIFPATYVKELIPSAYKDLAVDRETAL